MNPDILKHYIAPFLTEENRTLAEIFKIPDLAYINVEYDYGNLGDADVKKIQKLINFNKWNPVYELSEFKSLISLGAYFHHGQTIFNETDISILKQIKSFTLMTNSIRFPELKNMINLTHLNLGNSSVEISDSLPELKKLKVLYLPDYFDDGSILKCLPKLTELHLEYSRIRGDFNLDNIPNLGEISFGKNFNKMIYGSADSLEKFELGEEFNNPIFDNYKTPNLKVLVIKNGSFDISNFGKFTYESLENIRRLDITFDADFLDFSKLTNLTELKIASWNPQIKHLTKLKKLEFYDTFDSPIPELRYLTNLECLIFGEEFNQLIPELECLHKLKELYFGKYFNKPICFNKYGLKYLQNLKHLQLGSYYTYRIFKLPDSLKTVSQSKYKFNLDGIIEITVEKSEFFNVN